MDSTNYSQTFKNSICGQGKYVSQNSSQANNGQSFTFPDDLSLYISDNFSEDFADFENFSCNEDEKSIFCKSSKKISKLDIQVNYSKTTSLGKGSKIRNPWTPQEDAQLMELMKKHGESWAMISAAMPERTGKQIRDRYLNKLRPNIKKCGDWSIEEDQLVIQLINEIGNRWCLIATHLPGRTEGQVKNRYYSCLKKRLESNEILSQPSATRTLSETTATTFISYATSPETKEEKNVNSQYEFNIDSFINQESTFQNNDNNDGYMINKGVYDFEHSEESTTETENPFMYANPSMISYGGYSENLFFNHSQPDYFMMETKNASSDVDSFFSEDLRSEPKIQANSNDKLLELAKTKAYLELALAKTLEEINTL